MQQTSRPPTLNSTDLDLIASVIRNTGRRSLLGDVLTALTYGGILVLMALHAFSIVGWLPPTDLESWVPSMLIGIAALVSLKR